MSFLVAWRLWCLLGVAALAFAWLVSLRRRRRDTVRFTNVALLDVVAPERPGWRRHLPAVLWLVALTLLVVGFARPAREVEVAKDRATVILALDVSRSMGADDVDPNRLEVARQAASEFVASLPEELEVGLVTFSGSSAMTVAPSEDRQAVVQAIESLDEGDLADGTAIGDAIVTGLRTIESIPPAEDGSPTPGRVILMSDGERTEGVTNEEAAAAAAEAHVPVDTIAFGTADGVVDDPVTGESVPVPVAPEPLQQIAESTGGQFFEAASLDALTNAYQDIGTVVGYEEEKRDISAWFVGIGLALLATAGLLSLIWTQRLP